MNEKVRTKEFNFDDATLGKLTGKGIKISGMYLFICTNGISYFYWVNSNQSGENKLFLPSPYNWKLSIITIPKMNYIAVRGKGNPNEEDGAYQKAIAVLYTISYTLKMSFKIDYKIDGFYEYVAPPLEGFWWQDDVKGVDYSNKDGFNWISVIRLPIFISEKDSNWAVETATKKKKIDCSIAEFLTIDEGLCVQIMHIGAYDDESATVTIMEKYLSKNGYQNDISDVRLHHIIYLSDP